MEHVTQKRLTRKMVGQEVHKNTILIRIRAKFRDFMNRVEP